MKIATNTLATILIIAMLTLPNMSVAATSGDTSKRRDDRKLQRVYKHHDRKMELRASVLGLSPIELREQLRQKPFDTLIKQHGFKSRETFHTALIGKMKDELHRRGWSDQKIDKFLQKRMDRLGKMLSRNQTA